MEIRNRLVLPEPRSVEYRYWLKPCRDIVAGKTGDGRQFVTAPHYEGCIFAFFGREGDLLSWEQYEETVVFPSFREGVPFPDYLVHGAIFDLPPRVCCRVGPIQIQRFVIEEIGAAIEDYPSHWRALLAKGDEHDLEHLRAAIPVWLHEGNYVFHWNDDYWINREGDVVAA